jgi:hypothetical protein
MPGKRRQQRASAVDLELSSAELQHQIAELTRQMKDNEKRAAERIASLEDQVRDQHLQKQPDISIVQQPSGSASISAIHSTPRPRPSPPQPVGAQRFNPPIFDGRTDFDEFRSVFEDCAAINGWLGDDYGMGNWLRVHLRGAARSVIISNAEPYSTLVERLTARFGGDLMRRQYEQRLPSRRRKPGESLHQLADDIRRMCNVVYSDLPPATKEKMIVKHFEMALNDPAAQYELSRAGLTTLEQALQFAINRETFMGNVNTSPRAHNSNFTHLTTDSQPSLSATNAEKQPELQDMFSALLTEVRKIADRTRPRTGTPSTNYYNKNNAKSNKCPVCGADHPIYVCKPCRFCTGQHYHKDCPSKPTQQGNEQVPLNTSSK